MALFMTTSTAGEPLVAAADRKKNPSALYVALGIGIAAIGVASGYIWFTTRSSPGVVNISTDFTVFAGLFVLALAIERLIEPLASVLKAPDVEEAKKERSIAIANAETTDDGKEAANKQVKVDTVRTERSFYLWGVATGVAGLVCGGSGVLLLDIISTGTFEPRWLDLAITSLVVGAGTKPLHDLVSGLEKKKNAAEDPTSTTQG